MLDLQLHSPAFTNSFLNIGTDATISVLDNTTGQQVDMGGRISEIESKPKETLIESDALDNRGAPNFRKTNDGWEVTLTIERSNDNLEQYIAAQEAQYFATGQTNTFTITDQMSNGASTSSPFLYYGAVMMVDTLGQRKKKDRVEAKLTFHAITRVQNGIQL